MAGLGALALVGCASSDQAGPTGTQPTRGGNLRVGVLGAGTAESLLPNADKLVDELRSHQLFETLFDTSSDRQLNPVLALSAEPNADSTVWTLNLRDGVEWHNGKTFGSDDVVWTIQSWADQASRAAGAMDAYIDYNRVRPKGPLTVEVPLKVPLGQFAGFLCAMKFAVLPAGISLKDLARAPIGTGPFSFKSWEPGVESVFVANRNYREKGKPYVDQLTINSTFGDNDALVNALLAGDVDAIEQIPPINAKQQESQKQFEILRSPSAIPLYFYLNSRDPSLADPRVRRAIRLVADRQAIIDTALLGYGKVGNDLFGAGDAYFADDLKISQDIEQAKSLLKAAGAENLTTTIVTSSATPAGVESATLLAQQAKAAGITLNINTVPATNYWDSNQWPSPTIGQDYPSDFGPALSAWWSIVADWNETGWSAKDNDLLSSALKQTEPTKAREAWRDLQQSQFDEGGYLVWATVDMVDGLAPNVKGLKPSPLGQLGNFRLLDAWLA